MIRVYCALIVSTLIISTHTVNAFFLFNLMDITVTRNITCRLNDNETSTNDFQYCAIRIYDGWNGTQKTTFTIYDGLWYLNTFRQFIQKTCSSFQSVLNGDIDTGTGSGSCIPRSFETFADLQLCICATDNCNQNMSSCINSTISNTNISALFDFMPSLFSTVQCDNTLNVFSMCQEHPFINISACEDYVRNNSVLCAVTISGTERTQISLIFENYEAFLAEAIYQVLSVSNNAMGSSFNETETNVYDKYFVNDVDSVEECACTSYSLCNQNINTCLSQATLQIETTISIPSFTDISSDSLTSISTSAIISTATTTFTDSTTENTFTDFTTITGSTTTNTSTDSTMTAIDTDSATATIFTDSTMTTEISIITTSSEQQGEYYSIFLSINDLFFSV